MRHDGYLNPEASLLLPTPSGTSVNSDLSGGTFFRGGLRGPNFFSNVASESKEDTSNVMLVDKSKKSYRLGGKFLGVTTSPRRLLSAAGPLAIGGVPVRVAHAYLG